MSAKPKFPLLPAAAAGGGGAKAKPAVDHTVGSSGVGGRGAGARRLGGRGGGRGGRAGSVWNRGGIWTDLEKRQRERRRRDRQKAAAARASEVQLPAISPAAEERPPSPPQSPVFDEVEEMRKRSEQAARKMFTQADADGSGTLDLEEITELAAKLGHNLNRRQARAAMKQMDADGNGEVDFDEFYQWWVKGDIRSGPEIGIDIMAKADDSSNSPKAYSPMEAFKLKLQEVEVETSEEESQADDLVPSLSDVEIDDEAVLADDVDNENPFNRTLLPPSVLDQDSRYLQRGFDDSLVHGSQSESELHGYQARDNFFRMYHRRREGRLVETSPERARVRVATKPNRKMTNLQRAPEIKLKKSERRDAKKLAKKWDASAKVAALKSVWADLDEVELHELLKREGGDFDAAMDYLFNDNDPAGPNVGRGERSAFSPRYVDHTAVADLRRQVADQESTLKMIRGSMQVGASKSGVDLSPRSRIAWNTAKEQQKAGQQLLEQRRFPEALKQLNQALKVDGMDKDIELKAMRDLAKLKVDLDNAQRGSNKPIPRRAASPVVTNRSSQDGGGTEELTHSPEDNRATGQRAYLEACIDQGVTPMPVIIAKQKAHISHMNMANYCLGRKTGKAIAHTLSMLPESVTSIDLSHNDFGDASADVVAALAHNKQLTSIDLSHNNLGWSVISEEDQHPISPAIDVLVSSIYAGKLPVLKVLKLAANSLGDRNTRKLADCMMATDIEVLDLSRNKIGTDLGEKQDDGRRTGVGEVVGVALGEMIEGTDSLTDIDLSWNSVRGKGAASIGTAMGHGTTLKRINLSFNSFSDEGAEAVGQSLHSNSILEDVNLSNNCVGERGAFFLANGVKASSSMSRLKLRNNPIGAAGARAILSSVTVGGKEIDIEGCDLRSGENGSTAVPIFDRTKPNGRYALNLFDPYDASVARELLELAKKHGSDTWVKPKINKEPISNFDAQTWDMSQITASAGAFVDADGDGQISIEEYRAYTDGRKTKAAVLSLEFYHKPRLMKMNDVVDKSSFARLKSLLFRMKSRDPSSQVNSEASGMAMLDIASKEFYFSAEQVKDIVGLFDNDQEQVEVLGRLFERTVDVHKLDRTMDSLTEKERGKLKASLGSLYFFDPHNPTGHYQLDLKNKETRKQDAKLLDKLVLISNEEGSQRASMELGNTSQTGNWDCFRNEKLDGVALMQNNSKKKWEQIIANVRDVNDPNCTLPTSGILEFDFVSCFLRGQNRNTAVPTPYLPSEYQLKVLLTQLPKAPEPSEIKSFHNLRLLIKPYLFTVKQAQRVLSELGRYPSIQAEALIVIWGRIIDLCNMHAIFAELSPEQRFAVFRRLGILNVWSTLFPIGDYEMDLSHNDNRRVAEMLFEMDVDHEPGIRPDITLRGRKTEVTSCLQPPGSPRVGDGLTQSLADHAKKGTLKLTHMPAEPNWKIRKQYCLRTLTGDEMRRPLVSEAFNTGEADASARKLREKMVAWKKVQNAKGGVMNRLMGGTVASMMTDGGQGDGDNARIAEEHKKQRAAEIAEKNARLAREFEDEDEAAAYIQSCYRGHQARSWKVKMGRAATSIQKNYRGHQIRQMQQRSYWVTRIQAVFRGRRIRANINSLSAEQLAAAQGSLDTVTLFEQIPALTKSKLVQAFKISHWRLGEQVVQQDVYSDGFYMVAEGALSVFVNGNPVHRLSTWTTFGEMALVDSEYVSRATVVVESATARLLRLDRAMFFQVMGSFEEDEAEEQGLKSPTSQRER